MPMVLCFVLLHSVVKGCSVVKSFFRVIAFNFFKSTHMHNHFWNLMLSFDDIIYNIVEGRTEQSDLFSRGSWSWFAVQNNKYVPLIKYWIVIFFHFLPLIVVKGSYFNYLGPSPPTPHWSQSQCIPIDLSQVKPRSAWRG